LDEPSAQVRSIAVALAAVACRLEGAAGGTIKAGVAALALLEYAEGPAALNATTRYQ
jgi:hypothetical protein